MLSISKSSVHKILKHWKERGAPLNLPRFGRPKSTNSTADRKVIHKAKKNSK